MSPYRSALPALVGGVIVVGALGGFLATRSAVRGPSESDTHAFASSVAATVSARLEADGHVLEGASQALDGDVTLPDDQQLHVLTRSVPADRVMAVAPTTTADRATITVAAPATATASVVGMDLAGPAAWRLLLELARDDGAPSSRAAIAPDGQLAVLDGLALYGSPDVPADIAGRRAALKGFVVTVTPAATLLGLPSVGSGSELSVRVVQDDLVLGGAGTDPSRAPPGSAFALPLTTHGVTWSVQAWGTAKGSYQPWVVLAVGLALAALVAAIVRSRERSISAAVRETEARNQEVALIARTGPMLQQSLALGDLLPVFVVEVSDELGLDGISISLLADTGQLVRVFSLGVSSGPLASDMSAINAPPASVPPGATLTVPLRRAGRIVGAFQGRAAAGLTASQMETLLAVCDLLAAAVGNARLFQDEQRLVSRLRDLDRMKTTFVGSVSHELRTMVTAIEGFASLLEMQGSTIDSDRRADYVARISRNARSLGALVEDLLDVARFERSGVVVNLGPVDLSDLVPKVVDQMSSVFGDRVVVTDVAPDVTAVADAAAVERILVNLLSNAAKYTPNDTAVEVTLRREDGAAVLSVTDHGPGIPAEEREKVFDLFYRSDATARITRGVGIGLALARQLVSHLDGTIAIDETPGGGARFRVTIPLVDGAAPASSPSANEPARQG